MKVRGRTYIALVTMISMLILAGVHIGKNTVIGAGSIVTRDIPENVLALGSPCRVVREIGERDREFYYRDDRIDWDNLSEICEKKVSTQNLIDIA